MDVTKDDVRDLRDTLLDEMRTGFAGVHERQDKTNGRVNHAHESLAAIDVRVKNVEREVFARPRRMASPSNAAAALAPTRTQAVADAAGLSTKSRGTILAYLLGALATLAGLSEAAHAIGELVKGWMK